MTSPFLSALSNLRLAAKASLLLTLLLAPGFATAFDGYINVKNKTGFDVYYLYISHEKSDSWEEDVLGDDILESGEEIRVDVKGYSSAIFDVRLTDEDGDTYTFYDVDISRDDIIATIDDIDTGVDADTFEGYIEVTNRTGFDIYFLYISHEDSDNWEEDVLADDILAAGDSVKVDINGYASSIFDIRAEDEDGDTYTKYGIDVATEDLTLTLSDID